MTSQVLKALDEAARRALPQEACGILLGEGGVITRLVETRNVHPEPETHFEIDPQALIDAYREERIGGSPVAGYFHSHPMGPAIPSKIDQQHASGDGRIWAICGEGVVRFWRDEPPRFAEVSYSVIDG